MKNQKIYKFREIVDEDELEKIMRLRYETYFNSSMRNFLQINAAKIDIDIYDLHSRHFGLFCDEKPIGFIRIVIHKNEIYNNKVFSIGLRHQIFKKEIHGEMEIKNYDYPDFPFISYLEVPDSVKDYYSTLVKNKEGLVEASRLMLIGENKGIEKATFLTECAIVLYILICIGQKHAVINCDGSHARFYTRFGFKIINNSERYYLRGRTTKSSYLLSLSLSLSLLLSLSSIPKKKHAKFEEMAEEFKETNQIVRKI